MSDFFLVEHPLLARALSVMRAADTSRAAFRAAVAALQRLRSAGARDLRLRCVAAAPEGIAAVRAVEPHLPLIVAAVDRGLDENGYIRPGLGDAGDRIFGTD